MTAHPFVLGRLERTSLAEQAVQSLLQRIQDAKLGPGASLPSEARLGESLGVSRTVVREALRTLKGLGVIDISNGKSPTIRRELDATALAVYFSRAVQVLDNSTEDLMDVRASLEGRAAALAALRRTPEQLARMSDLVIRMQAQLRRPAAYASLDMELHLEISRASGNLLLFQIIGSIRASLEAQARQGMERRKTQASLQQVQDAHVELVERIGNRDAEGASRCMLSHMESALRVLPVQGRPSVSRPRARPEASRSP
ncbi:FCD domain-containing protein [Variovorax paradoxus]|uniref:FadR/GntR family transcriptional regulator n=1 Tax=Variovorax paradoxus TaxID=34073 RepID=UPI003AAEE593